MKSTFATKFGAVAALLLTGASSVAAQSFSNLSGVTLGNTAAEVPPSTRVFWNNASFDGENCNVGYVLTGAATAACANQNPNPWLPFAETSPSMQYLSNGNNAVNWMFQGGTYQIELLGLGSGGTIQGLTTNFGFFGGGFGDQSLAGSIPFSNQYTFSSSWGMFIDLAAPVAGQRIYSNANGRNFAVFANGGAAQLSNDAGVSTIGPSAPQTFYIGFEDQICEGIRQGCEKATDWDNQDIVLKITAVPEPSTYAMMGAGLLALVAVSRRRRTIA